MFRSLLLIAPIGLLTATPAFALEAPKQRVSLQASAGVNAFLPTMEFQVGYRLPVFDNRVEPFLTYAPTSGAWVGTITVAQIGCRLYGDPWGPLQPFALAALGYADATWPGSSGPIVMAGVGGDWMFLPTVGLSGSLNFGSIAFRPMLGLRMTF